MDKTEKTSVMQKTPSHLGVLPFYFVKAWPEDVDPNSRIKEAVKLFEEMDKPHFQMSKKIKKKLFEWEQEVSRLDDLKNYHNYEVLTKFYRQTILLEILNSELRDLRSASETSSWGTTKSESIREQRADIQKLNFLMLHQTKKLSEENKLLRDHINFRQKKREDEEMKISTEAEWKFINCASIKGKSLNPKISEESIRKKIQDVSDEIVEIKKEKERVEAKIKKAEKISGAMEQEIRCWVNKLKDKQHNRRKEAYLCMLDERRIYNEECWVLQYRNLECVQSCTIYMDKASSSWVGSCRHWTLNYNIIRL